VLELLYARDALVMEVQATTDGGELDEDSV
jgi:hypothetical protein